MNNKKTFGEFIIQKRKAKNLTQKEFAEKLYVTESAVSKWERGISYPDITLIRDICEVLQISEHELLTASEDVEARKTEKLAQKYVNLINRSKLTLFILYGIALITCFICNLAIQHTLSWFFIVLAAELVAGSITLFPIVLTKNRGLLTLASFTVSVIFLFFVCSVYVEGSWFYITTISFLFGMTIVFLPYVLNHVWLPEIFVNNKALLCFGVDTMLLFLSLFVINISTKGGWFIRFALPIALVSITLPWMIMLIIRYLRINTYFKTALCLVVVSVFHYYINGAIDWILREEVCRFGFRYNLLDWSDTFITDNINIIIIFTWIGLAVLFAVRGIIKQLRKSGIS